MINRVWKFASKKEFPVNVLLLDYWTYGESLNIGKNLFTNQTTAEEVTSLQTDGQPAHIVKAKFFVIRRVSCLLLVVTPIRGK